MTKNPCGYFYKKFVWSYRIKQKKKNFFLQEYEIHLYLQWSYSIRYVFKVGYVFQNYLIYYAKVENLEHERDNLGFNLH